MTGPVIEQHSEQCDNLPQPPSIIRLVGDEVQVHGEGSWMTGAVIEQLTEPHDSQEQLPSRDGRGDSLMNRDDFGNVKQLHSDYGWMTENHCKQ